MRILYTVVLVCISVMSSLAQCGAGEVEVYFNIFVDPWGEETYWELTPAGTGCGNQTIAYGSNAEEVGCALGIPITGAYGYPDNTMITEGPWCLVEGEMYDLYFYDSFGDGGLVFEIYQDGVISQLFYGQGSGNMLTFEAGLINTPVYDVPCGALQVTPDGPVVQLNNQSAIANFGEIHPPGSNCSVFGQWCETGVSNSVWAYFVAEGDKDYEISTCNAGTSFDTQIAVWKSTDCGSWPSFQLISSNDDKWNGCEGADYYSSTCYAGCLEQGAVYYIQIDGWNGGTGNAFLDIVTYDGENTLDAVVTNSNCPLVKGQSASGAIEPFIWGMGSNFSTVWTGPDGYFSTEHFVYNLSPGTYELLATDPCGNTYEGEYNISAPDSWDVSLEVTEATCEGSGDGSILVNTEGATGPYTYAWVGPGNITSGDNPWNGLYVGEYDLTITDSHGCVYNQSMELGYTGAFTFDLGSDTTLCEGEEMIVFAPVGLEYLWQDGSTNQFFEIIADDWGPGVHALVLTASTEDGCTHTDAFIFTVETCIGLEEHLSGNILVYPNPNNGYFQISIGSASSLEIVNALGQIVCTRELVFPGTYNFDAQLSPGKYFVRIISTLNGIEIVPVVITSDHME